MPDATHIVHNIEVADKYQLNRIITDLQSRGCDADDLMHCEHGNSVILLVVPETSEIYRNENWREECEECELQYRHDLAEAAYLEDAIARQRGVEK